MYKRQVSHELKTPVALIKGYAQTLARPDAEWDGATARAGLQIIEEEADRLESLINNLLDQAKIEAGRMDLQLEPTSPGAIAESALSMMEGYGATRGVHLKASFGREVPAIVVDVAKLRQALLNLLSNALKFTPEGSVQVVVERGFGQVTVQVVDTGLGIRPEDQAKLFQKFVQAQGGFRGLGVVRVHHGGDALGRDDLLGGFIHSERSGRGLRVGDLLHTNNDVHAAIRPPARNPDFESGELSLIHISEPTRPY